MRNSLVCFLAAVVLLFAGCNSGSKPISITITSPTGAQALDLGQSFTISVTVNNDKLAKGATFTYSGVGSLGNITGTGATYTAPATGTGGTATITITSATDPTKSVTLTVTVTAPPSISNSSGTLAAGVEGTSYTANVTTSGGAGTLTYTVTGNLPPGLTLNSSTGAITGTPTGPNGTANFTVKVTDSSTASPQTSTKAFTITVNLPPAPSISTPTLPAGTEGTNYNQTIGVTGGLAPFTYSISAGALPAGLAINSSTGAITGSPTGPNGPANFTVKVTDSSNPVQSAAQTLSIVVNLPAPPHISTTSLPSDVEGTVYDQPVQATGFGTLTYSISAGTLPAGLHLNASTGHINGTPTGPSGASSFTVKVTDGSNPAQSTTQALSITINLPPAPVITTTSLPGVVEFAAYNQTVQATGYGTLNYSISAGALPAGLGINPATGAITGTPTGPNGTANFTVKVTDGSNPAQSTTQALSIAVSLPTAPSITTTSLPNATVGSNYTQTLALTGGHSPFTWSISAGTLPAGFAINTAGVITSASVPNTPGTTSFTVKVVDSSNPSQSATQTLSISIVTGPLQITSSSPLPNGAVSEPYPTTTLGASGGAPPYTWTISSGALPTGMNPLSASGQISGTPTVAGPVTFTAKVTDSSSASTTKAFTITVNPTLSITTSSLPAGNQGSAYTTTNLAATGGVTPYVWSITSGSLPTGMNALTSSGQISGTPTAAGTFNFTVQVVDADGAAKTANLSIVINPPAPLTITTTNSNLPAGTINVAYANTQLNATGGIQPYTWSITTGALPTGMNALSSSGQISGTPTATGTFNFTVKVTDSATPTANTNTASLSIVVNPADLCASATTGGEALLNGQYAFLLKGYDTGTGPGETQSEPVAVGGVITFNGTGSITAGTLDANTYSSLGISSQAITSGTYKVDNASHRACLNITTASGTQHYRATLNGISGGVASTGHMVDMDSFGPFTAGIIKKQNPAAFGTGASQVSGNYAFGVSSAQNSANGSGGFFAAVGVIDLSAGSVTGGAVDFNSAGQLDNNSLNATWPSSPVSILNNGTYSVSNTTGRGALTFTPNGSSNAATNVIYVVSATDVLILSADDQASNNHSFYAGELLQQSGAGSFSNVSVSGNFIGYTSGPQGAIKGGSRADILHVNVNNSTDTITATIQQNHAGTIKSQSGSGSYTVAPSGRMLITLTGKSGPDVVLYLVSSTEAFILDDGDGTNGDFGLLQAQTSTSISGTFSFGTIDPGDVLVSDTVGVVTIGASSVNGTTDTNATGNGGQVKTGNSFSGSLSVDSTGLGLIPSGCSITTAGSCNAIFYVVSPTKLVILDINPSPSTAPSVQLGEQ